MNPAQPADPPSALAARVDSATPVRAAHGAIDVSVLVPVKDERENIAELVERVARVLDGEDVRWELLFVDDGSSDGSWTEILERCADRPEVRAIRQRRNFGKAAALSTGFASARGEVVVTMDGDLQDDPVEIPRFVAEIRRGYDVVSGWKQVRHDPLGKRVPSRLFNVVTRRLSGVPLHDFNCGFKAYTREAARSLVPYIYGEMHRYLPVVLAAQGYRVGEIAVVHHARRHGRSKYGVGRLLAGACDVLTVTLITRFRERPLHIFAAAAAVVFVLGGALTVALAFSDGVQTSLTALLPALTASVTLMATGLLCELVVHGLGPARAADRMAEGVGVGDPAPPEPSTPPARM